MATRLESFGAVEGSTVYSDRQLVARDVAITLPEVSFVTSEISSGGTVEIPIMGWTEAMEAAITKIGADKGLIHLLRLKRQDLEIRFVQQVMALDGTIKRCPCKAFLGCAPKTIPGIAITPGEPSENEITLSVFRYQLFINNEEALLIDKFAGICRVEGTDYSHEIESML